MKLITSNGRTLVGGLTDELPTGNLVWVDRINGHDASALRGRLDRPFLTLTAAKTAAASGDTIIVGPGVYLDANLARDGVNWHFLTGASVVNSSGTSAIFDVSSTISFKVTGQGDFSSTSTRRTLRISAGSPTVSVQCSKLAAESFVVEVYSSANLTINASQIQATGSQSAISVNSTLASVRIDADSITSLSYTTVVVTAGSVIIQAGTIRAALGLTISVGGGKVVVTAHEIVSDLDSVVDFWGGELTLNRSRVVSNFASGRAVYVSGGPTSGPAALRLVQCILISAGSNSIVGATSARPVGYYGQCIANKPAGSFITAQVSTLLSDTNVV